ncbi:hypothetical protein MEA186_06358 [Mesorhizobium amorphae CCNWGS0123]|uniref:Uncharacterized protein n=2 Tax=Mesorhizobium TaxID=68287 RepID=G6Y5R2_9HYPH|nr:hypothetical protein A6B35_32855 [Mesorhizobium amorphae CCNWGS0123]EHH12926.1 hypothetical protein MEA186_06358 [Mesorhizobium amorphae CCNWGS0123]
MRGKHSATAGELLGKEVACSIFRRLEIRTACADHRAIPLHQIGSMFIVTNDLAAAVTNIAVMTFDQALWAE